jgi:hypothetical protein
MLRVNEIEDVKDYAKGKGYEGIVEMIEAYQKSNHLQSQAMIVDQIRQDQSKGYTGLATGYLWDQMDQATRDLFEEIAVEHGFTSKQVELNHRVLEQIRQQVNSIQRHKEWKPVIETLCESFSFFRSQENKFTLFLNFERKMENYRIRASVNITSQTKFMKFFFVYKELDSNDALMDPIMFNHRYGPDKSFRDVIDLSYHPVLEQVIVEDTLPVILEFVRHFVSDVDIQLQGLFPGS